MVDSDYIGDNLIWLECVLFSAGDVDHNLFQGKDTNTWNSSSYQIKFTYKYAELHYQEEYNL